eukprot:gene15049-biopygen10502
MTQSAQRLKVSPEAPFDEAEGRRGLLRVVGRGAEANLRLFSGTAQAPTAAGALLSHPSPQRRAGQLNQRNQVDLWDWLDGMDHWNPSHWSRQYNQLHCSERSSRCSLPKALTQFNWPGRLRQDPTPRSGGFGRWPRLNPHLNGKIEARSSHCESEIAAARNRCSRLVALDLGETGRSTS